MQNAIPSHCAGFSSPCFRFEGIMTLMQEIQHPWGGKLHPFPMNKDGEGKSIPPFPRWSPATPWHRPGGRLSPSQPRGFLQLQVWPNCKTTSTSGEPLVALETFLQIAFSEGSTAQGKEGVVGLVVPRRAKLSYPERPWANSLGRGCLRTICPSTSATAGERQASPTSCSLLPSLPAGFGTSGSYSQWEVAWRQGFDEGIHIHTTDRSKNLTVSS